MQTAIIFAILAGQPAVLEYRGNLNFPYDPYFAKEISLEQAERRFDGGEPPVLFAMAGGPVIRAKSSEARDLLVQWIAANGNNRKMKAALLRAGKRARTRQRIGR